MELKSLRKVFGQLAKEHAEAMLRLLVNYHDLSASEAASRVGLHIKTAQEFLEVLAEAGLLTATEVYEKKRPYFRYKLEIQQISLVLDLSALQEKTNLRIQGHTMIRELLNGPVHFTTARSHPAISQVTLWQGSGRNKQEKKINLTLPQGRFLFHLPYPTAPFASVDQLIDKAGVESVHRAEIMDLLALMLEYKGLEIKEEKEES